MDWILSHTELIAGAVTYVIWEFWLGKTKLLTSNSTIELILEILYKVIGKILGKVNEPKVASESTKLSDADVASGQTHE